MKITYLIETQRAKPFGINQQSVSKSMLEERKEKKTE